MPKNYSYALSKQNLWNPCPRAQLIEEKNWEDVGKKVVALTSILFLLSSLFSSSLERLRSHYDIFSNSYFLHSSNNRRVCPVEMLAWYSLCSLWADIRKAWKHGGMLIDFNNQCFNYSFQYFVRAGHGTLALRRLRQEELKLKANLSYLVSKPLP